MRGQHNNTQPTKNMNTSSTLFCSWEWQCECFNCFFITWPVQREPRHNFSEAIESGDNFVCNPTFHSYSLMPLCGNLSSNRLMQRTIIMSTNSDNWTSTQKPEHHKINHLRHCPLTNARDIKCFWFFLFLSFFLPLWSFQPTHPSRWGLSITSVSNSLFTIQFLTLLIAKCGTTMTEPILNLTALAPS